MPVPEVDYQDAGDFRTQRQAFRKAALVSLRRREWLTGQNLVIDTRRGPVELPYMVGQRTQPSRFEMDRFWDGGIEFEVVSVAEDGVPIDRELEDLKRDAAAFERSERVSHGEASVPWQLELSDPENDNAVLAFIDEAVHG